MRGFSVRPIRAVQLHRNGSGNELHQPTPQSLSHADQQALAICARQVIREVAASVGDQVCPAADLIVGQAGR
jgi:hypothetical protein